MNKEAEATKTTPTEMRLMRLTMVCLLLEKKYRNAMKKGSCTAYFFWRFPSCSGSRIGFSGDLRA